MTSSWEKAQKDAKKQVDECIVNGRKIYDCCKNSFDTFQWPTSRTISAMYASHETGVDSKGKPRPYKITEYPEAGIHCLTCRKDGDDECTTYNVDPFDIYSSCFAFQKSCDRNIEIISKHLKNAGFNDFRSLAIQDQIALIILGRAIGTFEVKQLLKLAYKDQFKGLPMIACIFFLSNDPNTSKISKIQSTYVIQLRFLWCFTMVLRIEEFGLEKLSDIKELPKALDRTPLVKEIQSDLHENLKVYSSRCKKEGIRCDRN
jgi:hypothetical protein